VEPPVVAAAIAASGAVGFGGLVWLLPPPLILPAVSASLLVLACGLAVVAWMRPRVHPARLSYWDIAGAITFIGIAAALLSEPDQALPLLESARPLRAD
jgi:hypothetical protein